VSFRRRSPKRPARARGLLINPETTQKNRQPFRLECDGFYNFDRSEKFSAETTAAVAAANAALIAA